MSLQMEAELLEHQEQEERHNRQMRRYLMITLALISLGACATGAHPRIGLPLVTQFA